MTSIEDWSLSTLSSQIFRQQAQLIVIWELEIFWPAGRRQGYNCNLGTRDFLVAGPVATRQGYYCKMGTRDFLGCRPSWKMTGLQL